VLTSREFGLTVYRGGFEPRGRAKRHPRGSESLRPHFSRNSPPSERAVAREPRELCVLSTAEELNPADERGASARLTPSPIPRLREHAAERGPVTRTRRFDPVPTSA
jgi:hypothetical protein